jgi:alpha-mannosidase
MPEHAWRKRVVLPVRIPALGWGIFEMQWQENAQCPESPDPVRVRGTSITNGIYQVSARKDGRGVKVTHQGKPVFGTAGLHCITVEDPWGSWGNMQEDAGAMNLSEVRHTWKVTQAEVLEHGPERATLWVRQEGGSSRLDLSFTLYRQRAAVDVSARLFWNERSARLKMVMPVKATGAEYEVPGGTAKRGEVGEVPGGRWVRAEGTAFGFASDALYCFDLTRGALRATLVRATRYANDVKTGPADELWRPATDLGEHRFRFVLTPGGKELPCLAAELEMPPSVVTASTHPGEFPRSGSLASLRTEGFTLLALKPATDGKGWVLRLQETTGKSRRPSLTWLGKAVSLDRVDGYQIVSWRLQCQGGTWRTERITTQEQH